jgi:copper oxidase (laccase) domain-containing protein
VPEARITVLPGCTFCLPGFHSHRRDGAGSGRQWSLIVLTEGDRQEAKGKRR